MTDALSSASSTFAKANNAAAAYNQGSSAFDLGRRLARMSAGDNADQIMDRAALAYSPNEQSYYKAGFAQGLNDMTQGAQIGTGNPAAKISSGTVIQNASDVLDSPVQAQQLADALLKEKQRIDFANRGLNNSATVETASANLPSIPLTPESAMHKVAQKLGDLISSGNNQNTAAMLYSSDAAQKKALANALLSSAYYPQYGSNGYALANGLMSAAPAIPAQTAGAYLNREGQ